MTDRPHPDFATFARAFVRAYWETVKSGRFPMPPDEPVEETLAELLSAVSHTTELRHSRGSSAPDHVLRMTSTSGDSWEFRFHESAHGWGLAGCTTPSLDESHPHDLMAPPYAAYFGPFLQHVTAAAHDRDRRTSGHPSHGAPDAPG